MTPLPHLAARLFGAPLLIARPKLEVILAVLGQRIGLSDSAPPVAFAAPPSPVKPEMPAIAVIPIHGALGLEAQSGLTSYTRIAARLDAALAAGTPAQPRLSLLTDDPSMKATPETPGSTAPTLAPETTPAGVAEATARSGPVPGTPPAVRRWCRQPPPPGGEAPPGCPLIPPRSPPCPKSSKASTWVTSSSTR